MAITTDTVPGTALAAPRVNALVEAVRDDTFANVGGDGIMCGQGESVSLTLSMSKKNAPGILLSENSLMASRCIAGRYLEETSIRPELRDTMSSYSPGSVQDRDFLKILV